MKKIACYPLALAAGMLVSGCVATPTNINQTSREASSPVTASSPPNERAENAEPVTLPVLDAFFAEEGFVETLKTRLQLSDDQVTRLKELARTETAKLNEANAGTGEGGTAAARAAAQEKISQVIGEEKARQLAALVRERWSGTTENAPEAKSSETKSSETGSPTTAAAFDKQPPNAVPTDSRIVVNAPAFRMDVFDGGRLTKSYRVGIGYPQFPLPTGLRKANTIIFNPTWTPPDEPWVAKMNVNAGEEIEAGSKLNPLGPIKIPIGGPSLIHGGKSPAKIGTFASHGCVGLTTPQVRDFSKLLAQLGGANLTDADLARYARNKTETKQLKLAHPVPVELRYETIVVEEGKLHVYRDVYDQGTNTEENLRRVLEANGIKLEDLTADERAQVFDALSQLAGKSSRKITSASSANRNSSPLANANGENTANTKKKPARAAKNQKDIVIEIAALKGKGYPAPANEDTGGAKK